MTSRPETTETVTAPSEGLTFRPASLHDVDAVVALVESAYRGAASKAGR